MRIKWLLAVSVAVFALQMTSSASAFQCPVRFAAAEAAIDKATANMKGAMDQMPKEQMGLVHALIDDAKMHLNGGMHNHEKPQGAYDHARAVGKANAAIAYAEAAELLQAHYMK